LSEMGNSLGSTGPVPSPQEVDMQLSKRVLLAAAAPFALAAVYGGSVAFAQSGEPTPSSDGTTPPQQTDPTPTPSTPGNGQHDPSNCPNMGGSGDSSGGSGSSQQTRFAPR